MTSEYTCDRCGRVLRGYVGRVTCPTCFKAALDAQRPVSDMRSMDPDLYRHLLEWSEGRFAPGGYTPVELRETVRNWLAELPADEREEELGLRTWTQMFGRGVAAGLLFTRAPRS